MKDYDHVVVWTDYYNRQITRGRGRRMAASVCISDPSTTHLAEAAKIAGFEVVEVNEKARHPRRPYVESGYVVLKKTAPKSRMLYRLAPKLVRVSRRGKE